MRRATSACLFAVVALIAPVVSCDTPADAVKGMLDAVKAEQWEKAATFIDIEAMVEFAREICRQKLDSLPDEKRAEAEKELEQLDAEKVRKGIVEKMQDLFGGDFEYRILGTEETGENSAAVIVEFRRNEKTRDDAVPTAKIDGTWKVSFRDLMSVKEKDQPAK